MKNTNVIAYRGGAYGHFINWCCDYFSGQLNPADLPPLNDLGNCHAYHNVHLLFSPPQLKNYTESTEEYRFIQTTDSSLDPEDKNSTNAYHTLDKNFDYFRTHYKKVIFVYPTETSKLWILNNTVYKIRMSDWTGVGNEHLARDYFTALDHSPEEIDYLLAYGDDKIRKEIELYIPDKNAILQWNHNSIDEFARWELRELGSKFYYNWSNENTIIPTETIEEISKKYPEFYFIRLDELRDNFDQTIQSILKYFEISIVNWERIDAIYNFWLDKQFHINKDSQILQITNALTNQSPLDWSDRNLTLVDEMAIQKELYDNQIEIKCYGLDQFPTTTDDFLPLLERR